MNTNTIENQLLQVRELLEKGKGEEGRLRLLELLQSDPNHQAALMMLGGVYFDSGMLLEAEMVFERLVLQGPGEGRFSIALFNCLWQQNRRDEALEEIKRFLSVADREREKETVTQYMKIVHELGGGKV